MSTYDDDEDDTSSVLMVVLHQRQHLQGDAPMEYSEGAGAQIEYSDDAGAQIEDLAGLSTLVIDEDKIGDVYGPCAPKDVMRVL